MCACIRKMHYKHTHIDMAIHTRAHTHMLKYTRKRSIGIFNGNARASTTVARPVECHVFRHYESPFNARARDDITDVSRGDACP
jgi:hypothetical protein